MNQESRRRCAHSAPRFTFAEVLVAMVLMAVVLPVAVRGLLIANRAGSVAAKKAMAGRLADRFLAEAVLTQSWANGDTQAGDFGTDYPGYRWESAHVPWSDYEPQMQVVTVNVFYTHQGQEYSVSLSTLATEPQTQ